MLAIVRTVPIRLRHTPATYRVPPLSGIKCSECRRVDFAGDPEQRAEGVEGVKAPIEAEGELVEVGLQVLRAERLKMNTRDGLGGSEQRLVEANIMPGERVWELGWASLE